MEAQHVLALTALAVTALGALVTIGFQLRTGVAPVPAGRAERADVVALMRRAGLAGAPRIYELGSGWGDLALSLARAFPEAQVVGVELSPLPWAVARLRARGQPNLEIRRGDLFALDLRDADAVTCHLMMRPMGRLAEKLDRQLRPGTPVAALSFWFRGRAPAATLQSSLGLRGAVALYRWPAGEPQAPDESR